MAITAHIYYTCQEAAVKLGVTDARVRQLCIAHSDIGQKHGRVWLLTEYDVEQIRNLPEFRKKTPA